MEVRIKLFDKEDCEQILDVWAEESSFLHILTSSKLIYAFTAKLKGEVVGIIIVWENDYHPYSTFFRILIHPSFYQMGIEEKLLSTVDNNEELLRPLQTSIWETDYLLKEVYENNGFKEIKKTYLPTLKITDDLLIGANNKDYRIRALANISSDGSLMKKLSKLVKRIYEQTHLDYPVAELSLADWERLIMADDLIMDGSFVYLDSTETDVLAYSFLHYSEKEDRLELGWSGSRDDQHMDLILQLVSSQIVYGKKYEFQFMEGEFDTTSKYAMKIYNSIPFPSGPTWIAYQKK